MHKVKTSWHICIAICILSYHSLPHFKCDYSVLSANAVWLCENACLAWWEWLSGTQWGPYTSDVYTLARTDMSSSCSLRSPGSLISPRSWQRIMWKTGYNHNGGWGKQWDIWEVAKTQRDNKEVELNLNMTDGLCLEWGISLMHFKSMGPSHSNGKTNFKIMLYVFSISNWIKLWSSTFGKVANRHGRNLQTV